MPLKVLVFASLREQLGCSARALDARAAQTVADVWHVLSDGRPMPDNVLMAVNQEYVEHTHPVYDGDEVAFFPPVTGG